MSIRCGGVYDGYGAHLHNDQLAVTINDNGEDIITDPGTFLYTANPKLRNKYRSVQAHFTPQSLDIEPESLDKGIFSLPRNSASECLQFEDNFFLGTYKGSRFHFMRAVKIMGEHIIIQDLSFQSTLSQYQFSNVSLSPAYGWKNRSKMVEDL
jgi:hypothetical protein